MRRLLAAVTAALILCVPVQVSAHADRCQELHATALQAGWTLEDIETLDFVMWRESRCSPKAHNPTPPDNSFGVTQINTYGYLWLGHGGVRDLCGAQVVRRSDLFDPAVNLWCARQIFGRYGWGPWGVTAYAGHHRHQQDAAAWRERQHPRIRHVR